MNRFGFHFHCMAKTKSQINLGSDERERERVKETKHLDDDNGMLNVRAKKLICRYCGNVNDLAPDADDTYYELLVGRKVGNANHRYESSVCSK